MRTLFYTITLLIALITTSACSRSTQSDAAPSDDNNSNLAVIAATPTTVAQSANQAESAAEPPPTATPLPTEPSEPEPSEPEPTIATANQATEGDAALAFITEGEATRISDNFQGEAMANGSPYNKDELLAAHKELPLGTIVRITNLDTGQSVDVTITDRMPAASHHVIDVSRAAAVQLGMPDMGTAIVRIELLQ